MKKLILLTIFLAIASTASAGEHFLAAEKHSRPARKVTGFRDTIYGDHVFELQTGTKEGNQIILTNTGVFYYDKDLDKPCKVWKVGDTVYIDIQQ